MGDKIILASHFALYHAASDQVPYICGECGIRYTRKHHLTHHIGKLHPRVKADELMRGTQKAYVLKDGDYIKSPALLTVQNTKKVLQKPKAKKRKLESDAGPVKKHRTQEPVVTLHPSSDEMRMIDEMTVPVPISPLPVTIPTVKVSLLPPVPTSPRLASFGRSRNLSSSSSDGSVSDSSSSSNSSSSSSNTTSSKAVKNSSARCTVTSETVSRETIRGDVAPQLPSNTGRAVEKSPDLTLSQGMKFHEISRLNLKVDLLTTELTLQRELLKKMLEVLSTRADNSNTNQRKVVDQLSKINEKVQTVVQHLAPVPTSQDGPRFIDARSTSPVRGPRAPLRDLRREHPFEPRQRHNDRHSTELWGSNNRR